MTLLASDASTSRLLAVAVLSASASAALTYALLRAKHAGRRRHSNHASCCGSAPAKRDPYDPSPRSGYLSWDDYFMAVAFLSAQRSKDPNKQVGACIVDQNQVICGIGYNGFPRGCADSELPWAKKARGGDPLGTKYPYVCHAEMNAILNKNGASVAGAKIYVTLFPCNECAKLLIQAGIREIIFHEDKLAPTRTSASPSKDGFRPDQQYAASKRLLALAGVSLRQHRFRNPVTLRLTNHPAYPVVRSIDSAAVAAEQAAATAAAAAAAAAGRPAAGSSSSSMAPAGAAAAAAGTGASPAASPQRAAAGAAWQPSHSETVAAAAAAAAGAVVGGLCVGLPPVAAVGDLAGTASCPSSPLLAALAAQQYRWQLSPSGAAVSPGPGPGPAPAAAFPPSPAQQPTNGSAARQAVQPERSGGMAGVGGAGGSVHSAHSGRPSPSGAPLSDDASSPLDEGEEVAAVAVAAAAGHEINEDPAPAPGLEGLGDSAARGSGAWEAVGESVGLA